MPDTGNLQNDELKTKLQQATRHLNLMMDLSTLSTEAKDVKYFASRCLELIAKANGWVVGQYWSIDAHEEVIICAEPWFGTVAASELRSASRDRRFSKGIGLPGRVWSTGSAVTIEDATVQTGTAFLRSKAAQKAGLKGAFGFPIKNGPFLIGVFEFFTANPIKIDSADTLFHEKLGSFIGTFIAERTAEESARSHEAIYRLVLDRAYSGFIGIDQHGTVNVWNSRAEEMFGWNRDEVVGKPLTDFLIPERYRDGHIQGMFRYNAGGPPKVSNRVVRTPALHSTGKEVIVDLYIFPISVGSTKAFGAFVADANPTPRPPDIVLT